MIEFNESTHEYFNNGNKLISVTQLLAKHHLAPDYSEVDPEILKRKAERGTLIHAEIEDWIKYGKTGISNELILFKNYAYNHDITIRESEKKIGNDLVAGTCDLIYLENHDLHIADFKTTSVLHIDSVTWQLSLYAYLFLAEENTLELWNEIKIDAFHFTKDEQLNVVSLKLKPLKEVERLLECERNGEIYKQEVAPFKADLQEIKRLEDLIKYLDDQKKAVEEQSKTLKEALIQEMEARDIKTFENDELKITYVAPQARMTIDSTRLKKELPDIAKEYTKITNVKASVRITIKGEE